MQNKAYAKFLILMTILLCSFETLANASMNEIKAIRAAFKNDKATLVLEFSQKPNVTIFTLKTPNRLVIDIKHTFLKLTDFSEINTIFKNFRYAKKQKNDLRLVFENEDLIHNFNKNVIFPDENHKNYRLIVELQAKNTIAATKVDIFALADETTAKPKQKPKIKQKALVKKIIVIDPGHGGKDPGAIGKSYGTYEKYITFRYAKELQKILNSTKKYRAILTREGDYYLKLHTRVEKAKKHGADLFISIHADSSPNRKARGMSIYTLSEKASDRESARIASNENKADFIASPGEKQFKNTEPEIVSILFDLAKRSKNNQSTVLASHLISQMKQEIRMVKEIHRFAGFRVLKGSNIPSVLIELGYLSNKHDEKTLNSTSYRRKVVHSIKNSLDAYFASKAH